MPGRGMHDADHSLLKTTHHVLEEHSTLPPGVEMLPVKILADSCSLLGIGGRVPVVCHPPCPAEEFHHGDADSEKNDQTCLILQNSMALWMKKRCLKMFS